MIGGPILVVEDNPLNRALIVDCLQDAGYRVLEAEDGVGLLERVKQERPALILLDLQLPGVDGLTLARRLKADLETESLPIIAVTAYARSEDRTHALAAGCAGYLTKPLDMAALIRSVAQMLGCDPAPHRTKPGTT